MKNAHGTFDPYVGLAIVAILGSATILGLYIGSFL
jgi:hypothetical protein